MLWELLLGLVRSGLNLFKVLLGVHFVAGLVRRLFSSLSIPRLKSVGPKTAKIITHGNSMINSHYSQTFKNYVFSKTLPKFLPDQCLDPLTSFLGTKTLNEDNPAIKFM